MHSPILAPAVVLVLWSLVVLGWLALTRLPAMRAAGVDVGTLVVSRGPDLQGVIPDRVNWVAHNYEHLMEQPIELIGATHDRSTQGHGAKPIGPKRNPCSAQDRRALPSPISI